MAEENKNTASTTNNSNWADKIEINEEEKNISDSTAESKILNQEEIDSLLGYHNEDDSEYHAMKTGVRAILNGSMVSYERLPMLEIVFDRLIRLMATSLRNC